MKSYQSFLVLLVVAISAVNAFTTPAHVNSQRGGSFVVSQRPRASTQPVVQQRTGVSSLHMGNVAKFGVFSPAVYAAKVVLGAEKLNKIRGKAISLHSQYIGEFCEWYVFFSQNDMCVVRVESLSCVLFRTAASNNVFSSS
jgi:hypothetical protein